ncbi:MAG: heparinase II/III family protein [Phycisphaerae bacterium]
MRRGILATREELGLLRQRIFKRPFDGIYDVLRKRCALILESSPTGEQQWRAMAAQGSYAAALLAARTAQGRIMDLAIAHHADRNPAYRDRAVEELKALISWSTWVDPVHAGQLADLCTAEAAVGAVVGLDWLWEDMTEPDRLRVLHAIRHKAVEPYHKAVSSGAWWYNIYHSWNAVVNSGCGLAGLALGDDVPMAQEAFHKAVGGLRRFFAALGREGGWDEGTGYWGYAMRYVLLLGEAAARLVDDHSIFHTRGIDATGLFPIYFTPNGQPASFGDMPSVPLLGTMYLLVKHFGLKEVTWWLDTYAFHRDVSTTDWSAAGLALLFRPADADVPLAPDLKPLKVFNEIGWAAMADAWPRPSLYVAAKTGDSAAHNSQRDMNSIQLQAGGEMLLTDPGHGAFSAEYLSSARDRFYEVQARAHNTLTIGEEDHEPDAQGSIIEAQSGANYRWVACDAGTACGENVHYVRHVVMVVNAPTQAGRLVLVLDELVNPGGPRVDLAWHTMGRIECKQGATAGRIVGSSQELHFAMTATSPMRAALDERVLGPGRADRALRVTIQGAAKLMVASVFSPRPLAGNVELKRNSGGEVRVKAAGVSVHFRGLRKHLQLDKVVC